MEALMNFSISKNEFYEALHKIVGVVPQKTTMSILTSILFELEGNKLKMTGSDLEISVSLSLNVTANESGSAAIPAKLLLEIVRELPNVSLNIFSDKNDKVTIKTEKGEYKIATLPKEDFPHINFEESHLNFELSSDIFSQMTNKTIFAVSNDELRPALTGIYMEIEPSLLRFVSTDGHRLSRYIYKSFASGDNVKQNLIVPTKALNLALRNIKSDQDINIQIGDDHIIFQLDSAVIYSKLINGTYPDYERVIPSENDKNLIVNRDLLLSTLRRISIFSNSITNQVRVSLSQDEMMIHSEDIEFGAEGRETIQVDYAGDSMQIAYNSLYLMDILKHLDSEDVKFELKDSEHAAILKPSETDSAQDITMLLMPIRISEEPKANNSESDRDVDYE